MNDCANRLDCNKGVQFLEKLQGNGEDSFSPRAPSSRAPSSQPSAVPSRTPPLPSNPPPLPSSASQVRWKDHPLYHKYFKLLQMGMPVEHVQSKMQMDGLDEHLLELCFTELVMSSNNPDAFVPEAFL